MSTDAISIDDLTQATVGGTGVFDVLMRANKAHLEQEFSKSRIKGPEYATVYLGSLETVMSTALEFLMQREKIALEAQLLEQQIILTGVQVQKANAELLIIQANLTKIPLEIALLEAQVALTEQQAANMVIEQDLIEAKVQNMAQQNLNLVAEALNIPKQGALIDAQKAQASQQTLNLVSQELQIKAQTSLIGQQAANAIIEGTVLTAQKCKLDAEFDLLGSQNLKTFQETALLAQKVVTEKAQTTALGVDADSVIGKQKSLYGAQTDGFKRDAEQRAAKIFSDSWSVRRTTDEGTVADGTNMLNDAAVGRAMTKLLAGVNA